MKLANRICIFLYGFLCIITLGALSREIYLDNKLEENRELQSKKAVQSDVQKEYKYVVLEEENTLIVYYAKDHTRYMTTGISFSELPEKIQSEVQQGLNFYDEKSLFGFLEDYSS